MSDDTRQEVRTAYQLRVRVPDEPGVLTRIMTLLRQSGEQLSGQLTCRMGTEQFAFFLCDNPTEAAVALSDAGFEADTDTVVIVRTRERTAGIFRHLVRTMEVAGATIEYSYAAPAGDGLFAVFRTDDNPRAEDALRNYLCLDDSAPDGSRSHLTGTPPRGELQT